MSDAGNTETEYPQNGGHGKTVEDQHSLCDMQFIRICTQIWTSGKKYYTLPRAIQAHLNCMSFESVA